MEETIKFVSGLNKSKKDYRDFKFEKVFGSVTEIPEFQYEPTTIYNQKDSDFCVACTVSAISEYLDKHKLSPFWQFAKIKEIEGSYKTWGADFTTGCKSTIKYGSLPIEFETLNLDNSDRDKIANWENWSSDIDVSALPYKKKSYFNVSNGFQNLISAMWINKSPMMVGADWQSDWLGAEKGIIDGGGYPVGNHAMKALGYCIKNNRRYLICQNSYGLSVGDNGLFYFEEEVVNKYFFSGKIIVDLDPIEAKQLSWNERQKLLNFTIKVIQKLILKLNELYDRQTRNLGFNP